MPWRRPTMTLTPSINISSDQTADRRERSKFTRAGTGVGEGTTLATLWKPGLRPGPQRGSPKPVHAPPDLDLFARFSSGTDDPGSRHFRQKRRCRPGPTRERYPSPRGNRPTLLFAAGHLLRLHGDLYVAIPGEMVERTLHYQFLVPVRREV